jgi:hypothetical protein
VPNLNKPALIFSTTQYNEDLNYVVAEFDISHIYVVPVVILRSRLSGRDNSLAVRWPDMCSGFRATRVTGITRRLGTLHLAISVEISSGRCVCE